MKIYRYVFTFLALSVMACSGGTENGSETASDGSGTSSELVTQSVATMDQDRKASLEANLTHQLRHQLQGQTVNVVALGPSDFADLDIGRFVIGQQSFTFLTSHDDTQFFVLATDPFNAGLSVADMADEIAAEQIASDRDARERASILAEATVDLPFKGAENAPVLIVEFSDFQCPYCQVASETVKQVLENHPDDVRFVYAHFPLDIHPWAVPSAVAAVCAASQDKSAHWTLHDSFFANQEDISEENVIAKAREFLAGSGIDMAAWETCAVDTNSEEYQSAATAVNASFQLGRQMGVSGTPGFFINGVFGNGAIPIEAFETLIATALADME